MRMIVRLFKRVETLEYKCEKGSEFWRQNIKKAIECFDLENEDFEIYINYHYKKNCGYTMYFNLQPL